MKKLVTSIVTIAAMMALTIGACFATPKAACCNGDACCKGGACCHRHQK
jgi:hypothetical protein